MGKILFVDTNRVNGWFGVVLCSVAMVGGVYGAVLGAYAALAFTAIGALGIKYCLRIATQRTEVYEAGFRASSMFGTVSARYADLKSVVRMGVMRNGVMQTTLIMKTQGGERVQISTEKLLKQDEQMSDMLDRVCGALADTWEKRLEKQKEVDWIVKGSRVVLKIRREGVLVEGNAAGLIPLDQFQVKPMRGPVAVCKGEQKVTTVNAADANYYTGLFLIEKLRGGQSKSMPAKTGG